VKLQNKRANILFLCLSATLLFTLFLLPIPLAFSNPAYEDFTTYTEVDPNTHITISNATYIISSTKTNEDAYVYSDKGAGHFTDFEHLVKGNATGSVNDWGFGIFWALTNDLDDVKGIRDANKVCIFASFYRNTDNSLSVAIYESDSGNWYSNFTSAGDLSWNKRYYFSINKTGTYFLLEIYNHTARTESYLEQTLSLTLHTDPSFRYVHAIQTLNIPADRTIYFRVARLDLQEVVNADPVNNSVVITNMDDTTYLYSKKRSYNFIANWSDADGLTELDFGKINFTDGLGGWIVVAVDIQSNAYTIEDGSEYISVGSITNATSGTSINVTIPIELDWDIGDAVNIEIFLYVNDTNGASDPTSGFEEKQTNYANIETDLVFIDLEINDYIVPNNTAITFNGTVIYQGSTNNVTPPDTDYNLNVTLSGSVKGSDSTLVSGYFEIQFNSESTEGNYYYFAECDYNATQGAYSVVTVYIGEIGGTQMGFIVAGVFLILMTCTPIIIIMWRRR
jgi:hypothetical protein